MKQKCLFLIALVGMVFSINAQIEVNDDFESYTLGAISAQSTHWRTWSGTANGPEDGVVTNAMAFSGVQSLEIGPGVAAGGPQDQLLLVESQPSSGLYTIKFRMYVPTGNEGYFNLQGEIAQPQVQAILGGNIYFNKDNANPGGGIIADGAGTTLQTFTFTHDTWMDIEIIADMAARTFDMNIDGTAALTAVSFGDPTQSYLGGVDFFAASASSLYYIDDVILAVGTLGTEDFTSHSFSVYPNPVATVLHIRSEASINAVTIYDLLGKVVLQAHPNTVSPSINTSSLASGVYLAKISMGKQSKTIKLVK